MRIPKLNSYYKSVNYWLVFSEFLVGIGWYWCVFGWYWGVFGWYWRVLVGIGEILAKYSKKK